MWWTHWLKFHTKLLIKPHSFSSKERKKLLNKSKLKLKKWQNNVLCLESWMSRKYNYSSNIVLKDICYLWKNAAILSIFIRFFYNSYQSNRSNFFLFFFILVFIENSSTSFCNNLTHAVLRQTENFFLLINCHFIKNALYFKRNFGDL